MEREIIAMDVNELFGPDSGIELSVVGEEKVSETNGEKKVRHKSGNDMDAVIQKVYHNKDGEDKSWVK